MGDADPPVSRLETRHGPVNARVLGGPGGGVLLALGGMGVTGCGPHFLASGVAQHLAKTRRVLLPDVYSAAATRPSLGEFAGEFGSPTDPAQYCHRARVHERRSAHPPETRAAMATKAIISPQASTADPR